MHFYELRGAGTLFANNQRFRNAVPLRPKALPTNPVRLSGKTDGAVLAVQLIGGMDGAGAGRASEAKRAELRGMWTGRACAWGVSRRHATTITVIASAPAFSGDDDV